MFYSKTTNGFYDEKIHGDAMPEDKVEITEAYHAELLQGQSEGKAIYGDEVGYPRLKEQDPLSPEEVKSSRNRLARAYLSSTDWYVVRRSETGEEIPQEILDKRAAARLHVAE